ncbi:DUF4198 domain-containing protein [Hymenobacter perfusus]|uniref:DUF4198 domain-containing protein n=1 Tax=Hymenobacter perfusus TaxID=1236770 RepID=A0A3R9MEP4_9BACT|nr:DUF4198 domain-containing protein [Hymenobacter perfusus]RSK44163.1 DUF4198 domain-containing protein [Hymenobacter perfusus]
MQKYLLAGLLLVTTTGLAREFWLEPARFWVAPGAAVHVRRVVGGNFQGTAWAGKPDRVMLFTHYAPGGAARSLLPAASAPDTLQSTVQLLQPGTHLLALATNNASATLDGPGFTAYLREEGLDYAVAQREQRHETDKPGREAYRRCAKTLVQVGPATAADTARAWARPLGLPLELVPEQNPYRLAPGAAFTVRVLLAGQPLPGQQVVLWRRGTLPQALISKLRSNQNGRVLFRLSEPGEYLVSTVRIEPAPIAATADWQSTWSTLTFGLAGPKRP